MNILKKLFGRTDRASSPAKDRRASRQEAAPVSLIPQQKHAFRDIPKRTAVTREPIPTRDILVLQEEIEYLNQVIQCACELAHLTEPLALDLSEFFFSTFRSGTHYFWAPYTPFGKVSPYPLVLYYHSETSEYAPFATKEDYEAWMDFRAAGGTAEVWETLRGSQGDAPSVRPDESFGEVYYLRDGLIGKARLIFWRGQVGYFIHLEQAHGRLTVKKVVQRNADTEQVLYHE